MPRKATAPAPAPQPALPKRTVEVVHELEEQTQDAMERLSKALESVPDTSSQIDRLSIEVERLEEAIRLLSWVVAEVGGVWLPSSMAASLEQSSNIFRRSKTQPQSSRPATPTGGLLKLMEGMPHA